MQSLNNSFRNLTLILVVTCCAFSCSESSDANRNRNTAEQNDQPPSEVKAAGVIRNTINWTTATEEGIFGFILERAESEDGTFTEVNARPLAGGGNTDEPRFYTVTDEHVEPLRVYYYRIVSLGINNRRKIYSPIFPYQTPAK